MTTGFRGKYEFLSNFYPCPITVDGVDYPTVEHAYQAQKTTDSAARQKIALVHAPGSAKSLGRRVPLRPDWGTVKNDIMLELLRQKFRSKSLKGMLLATNDEDLVEHNNWGDTYWGVSRGKGKNMLGQLLMKVRAELKEVS